MSALVFDQITKSYGRSLALDSLSFSIPSGSITGFVGPNGAGKTTSFSVVSGFLRPDSGTLSILGNPTFDAATLKGRLGVLPQDAELSDRHTPTEILVHLARLQGLSKHDAVKEARRLLAVLRLDDRANHLVASLSHGMRRRIAVASALLGSPELVLLDEPMAGLDPMQAKSLRDVLAKERGKRTLVVSSHNLDELERLCDYIVMLEKGRCLREGSLAEITHQEARVEWKIRGEAPLKVLEESTGHRFVMHGEILVETGPVGVDLDASSVLVMKILASSGVAVREVRRGLGLERQFFEDSDG